MLGHFEGQLEVLARLSALLWLLMPFSHAQARLTCLEATPTGLVWFRASDERIWPGLIAACAGQAVSNVFDGHTNLGGSQLRGVTRRCRIGLLTLFEWYKYVEVRTEGRAVATAHS